jgi:hypothetical protein
MTTKPPSGLAASGPVDDPESEQITKEHNDDGQDISVDPSEDVTVEATEDVTTEAASHSHTPAPSPRGGPSAAQRAPTLLGVPIQSLPLPGVTAASGNDDMTREINYDDEITVLGQPAPADPLAALDAYDALDALDDRPSITDDDEEETKVEPAEAAMKAAESTDDVTTALSAQASLEREKALRRAAPAASPSDDLEFADPEAEEEEESLDDELDDDDEVISAGGAIEEEEDADGDDEANDGVATATFMKPADSTGLSGLLNPRRPPTGSPFGRDGGFGSARLPTPYPAAGSSAPAPSTSPFASRLGPAPVGSPYSARQTGLSMPAIQIPAPSGAAAATATEPGFLTRRVPVPAYALIALVGGSLAFGFGLRGLVGGKNAAVSPSVAATTKPPAAPTAPAVPVVEPVVGSTAATPETKSAIPAETAATKPATPPPTIGEIPSEKPSADAPEAGLWKPAKKPVAPKAHKVAAIDALADDTASKAAATPKPAVAASPKPVTPKPAIATAPKPAAPPAAAPAAPKPTAAAKPAKKATKVWVDPFAN